MRWSRNDIDYLMPILEQISTDLSPVDGKSILVLCSGTGEVALRLAEMMESGHVMGLELDPQALDLARRSAHEMGLENVLEFLPAERNHIPAPDATFDGLVSEFIVYPTSIPTEIGQAEMARVLAPGGRIILTDLIVTAALPQGVREALLSIGMDYLCEASQDEFKKWMEEAGLSNIRVDDLTPTLRQVWEDKREVDHITQHQQGYTYLLDNPRHGLGAGIFYIYVQGVKPINVLQE